MSNKGSKVILLVDDDAINLLLLRSRLKNSGFKIIEAVDGKMAIDTVRSQTVDIILMDISMPVMNGCEATETLRKDGFKMPIIAVTALIECSQSQLRNKGFNELISKPINFNLLMVIIQEQLQKAENEK